MEEVCSTCLCSGRKLGCINGTTMYYFYKQILNEIAAPEELQVKVCWECRALLRRFQGFQHQVKCCYVELVTCLQQNPSLKLSLARTSQLQSHCVTSISIPDVKPQSLDIKIENDEVHCEPETFVNTWGQETRRKEEFEVNHCKQDVSVKQTKKREREKTKKKQKKRVKLKQPKMKKELSYDSDVDCFNNTDDAHVGTTPVDACDTVEIGKGKDEPINTASQVVNEDRCDTDIGDGTEDDVALDIVRRGPGVPRTREVLPERPQCVECGKIFSSRKTYRYHLNVLHKGQNRHECPKCGKVYQWKSNLGRHMRTHKARESGELYCAKCDKSFASVATYRQHVRISRRHVSESEFTFTCDECGKKFVNKTRLRDHVDWEHLNKIKFRCQLCNKPFKCHTSLYVHMQNVHRNKEKKDNLCHVCGKSYQNAAKLKYHIIAMHTSETPYQCAECDAAFGWYSSLYRHIREVHYKMKIQSKKGRKDKKLQLPELLGPNN
ncbi:unnamed protein product [Leptosia nina]|uniref:C2H2-type domain-containing protein n=1 Tax=Leptosia nina TaxID=320188 RepID=A0AAV1JXS3_9NEOP